MKTIDQYKEEFIKLATQFEKEHGCSIKSITIERYSTSTYLDYSVYHYSCNITT